MLRVHKAGPVAVLLLVAAACHYEDRRWAPVAEAHGRSIELAQCLSQHQRHTGSYPARLASLVGLAQPNRSTCGNLDAEFIRRAEDNYAGYRWSYGQLQDGRGFMLRAWPVSERPHKCTLEVSERLVLTQSCTRRFFGPAVQLTTIPAPSGP